MSALESMNQRGLNEYRTMLANIKRTRRRRREELIERLAAAETELRDHDVLEGVLDFQIAFTDARLAEIAAAAKQPEHAE